ncbi:PHD finger protein 7-like [Passer montanus]|uniref:PHD finger protein 7-like n=1 Tax=Passer montanus TaxID=9160 RepID=UPI00195F8F1C|nr:PHD finger protein 7-like [Passer montanus]
MSDRKQEGPGARKPACMLCHRVEADPDACGDKVEKGGLCAHVFCLFFATLLFRQEEHPVGLMGFLPRDIQIAVWRAAQKRKKNNTWSRPWHSWQTAAMSDRKQEGPGAREAACMLCHRVEAEPDTCGDKVEKGGLFAHVFCMVRGCGSYCPEHRPEQEVRATPEPGTDCPICMEPVEDRKTFETMVCPTCKRAWFHRDCTQGQAMRAGALFFQCPLCRDSGEFAVEMFFMGIRVPFRQPTWEDNDAFADLRERHSMCNARECLYPGGREEAEHEGAWQLLLCSSCAAEGTHRRCSGLRNKTYIWECDSCAGLGTSGPAKERLAPYACACLAAMAHEFPHLSAK